MDAGRFLQACAADDLQHVSHMLTQLTPGTGVDLLAQGLTVANISEATSVAELLKPVVQMLVNQVDSGSTALSSEGPEVRARPLGQDASTQEAIGDAAEADHASGELILTVVTEEPSLSARTSGAPLEALFRGDALVHARRLRGLANAIEGVDVASVARAIAAVRAAAERGDPADVDAGLRMLKESRAEGLLVYLASWETPSGKKSLPYVLLGGEHADDMQALLSRDWPSLVRNLAAADAASSRDAGGA